MHAPLAAAAAEGQVVPTRAGALHQGRDQLQAHAVPASLSSIARCLLLRVSISPADRVAARMLPQLEGPVCCVRTCLCICIFCIDWGLCWLCLSHPRPTVVNSRGPGVPAHMLWRSTPSHPASWMPGDTVSSEVSWPSVQNCCKRGLVKVTSWWQTKGLAEGYPLV